MRKPNRRTIPALRRAAALAVAASAPAFLGAASSVGLAITWSNSTGDSDRTWSSTGNWVGGVAPGGTDMTVANTDVVTFGSVSAGSLETPLLDASRRLGNINFDNSGASYNLDAGAATTLAIGGNLTITGGGLTTISPALSLASTGMRWDVGTTSLTIANNIRVGGGRNITLVGAGLTTLLGSFINATSGGVTFSGNGNMLISGNYSQSTSGVNLESLQTYTGTLTLGGTNTIGGNIVWRAGRLEIASAGATGGTGVTLSAGSTTGGALSSTIVMTGAYTVSRNLLINGNAISPSITIGGTQTSGVATYSGTFNLNGTTVAALNLTAAGGGTVDFSGAITSSASNMNKSGLGTVRFTNAAGNTYSGRTSVAAGTLLITNTSGSGTGTAAVQVGSGGTFGGPGRAIGPVTVFSGGTLRAGAGDFATGALTLASDLTLSDSSRIQLVLGNGGTHTTLVRSGTGGWTFDTDQAFDIIGDGTVTPGQTYDNIITGLAAAPGTLSDNVLSQWQITTPQWAGTFTWDGANVDLTTTATPEPAGLSLLAVGGLAMLRRRRRRLEGGCTQPPRA